MAGNIPTEKVAQSMRQDVRLVGGVGNMPAGEEVDRSMVVDVGLDGSGDNMPAGEEVDQGVGHDVGLVGRDGNLLVRRMGQEDRVRDGEGDEGGNSPSVEMGDNRDSEFDDLVEKKEDPLGVEVDKEIVTNNMLTRLREVDQTTLGQLLHGLEVSSVEMAENIRDKTSVLQPRLEVETETDEVDPVYRMGIAPVRCEVGVKVYCENKYNFAKIKSN